MSHGKLYVAQPYQEQVKESNWVQQCLSFPISSLPPPPPRGHHRLRKDARGSEAPCPGMATQEAPRQPRGPWGHLGLPTRAGSSPGFQTSSVFQQTLVKFAEGAKSTSKHHFPASARPGSSAAFSGLIPSPPSPQRTNPVEVALCLPEGI